MDVVGCSGVSDVMSCLRNSSIGTSRYSLNSTIRLTAFSGAITAAINANPQGYYSPVVDGPGGFLPELPATLITSGNFSSVDFIGGHCTDDGSLFVGGTPDQFVTDQDIIDLVFPRWGDNIVSVLLFPSGLVNLLSQSNATKEAALALYPAPNTTGSPYTTQYDRAVAMAGNIVFTCM